jgi:periplasmic glucans biosynthesis protein
MSVKVTRRRVIGAGLASTLMPLAPRLAGLAFAQTADATKPPNPRFGYEDVVQRARDLASVPFDATPPQLPAPIANLDFDSWRDIRFRPDKAFFQAPGSLFQLQLFHLGFNFKRPVVVNIVRDGMPAPIPYSPSLFDFGRTKIDKPLPVSTGFAGFRLHYPVNDPKVMDELIAFLGASYFRFLGRRQLYGLSARGLAINAGVGRTEEFPFFREFWVEQPAPDADRITVHALLDGESVTGAFRFIIFPGQDTAIETQVTLIARRQIANLGLAPLTSMFLTAESDLRVRDDYRMQVHDSDGLLMQAGSGEWIWRPLLNPAEASTSVFLDKDIRGFGLMQRDRVFDHYEDIDLHYERRPSYWVEPFAGWGEGAVELTEAPAQNEATDNIVAVWRPKAPLEPGQTLTYGYRLRALLEAHAMPPGGKVHATFQTVAKALGSSEAEAPGSRRFLIDFAGGELAYYLSAPEMVEIVASVSTGRVLRTFLSPNPDIKGFRAGIDVALEAGQSADIRAFLRARTRALTETWTRPWKAP